jgi:type I restriction enzyme M protein
MEVIEKDSEFFKYLEEVQNDPIHVFRGVISKKFELIPKIGRHFVTRTNSSKRFDIIEEKLILDLFQQKASSFLKVKESNSLELIVIAQHYGVPTRLLDWTYNPLVAAFFAVENFCNEDSVIYYAKLPQKNNLDIKSQFDPFKIKSAKFYFPDHFNDRLRCQWGLFSVSPDPYKPIQLKELKKVIIKQEYKRNLKYLLYRLGIHNASIYPDMEGAAKHIYWLRTDIF